MNKQEKIIVAILALALIGSVYFTREDSKARAEYLQKQQAEMVLTQQVEASRAAAALESATTNLNSSSTSESVIETPAVAKVALIPEMPEQVFTLSNAVAVITFTSKGGAIKSATLLDYNKTKHADDGKVELDFSGSPSLALEGLPGLGLKNDFAVVVSPDAQSAVITASSFSGITLERHVSLTNGYSIAVSDLLRNTSSESQGLSEYSITLGSMSVMSENGTDADLAIDTKVVENDKTPVIEIVKGTKQFGFAAIFGASGGGCKATLVPPAAPAAGLLVKSGDVLWTTVRERFFLQVLTPAVPASGLEIRAVRNVSAPGGALVVKSVSSALVNPAAVLEPDASLEKTYSLYIGPRQMSELRKLGEDYTKIMRFGTWSFFCRGLLDILNFLYGIIPNYGIAIILITAMVRLILYPVNKKNADSMRKMQEIQPLIKEVQAKFKEDPKKLQSETMRIYGENKVNPLSSCLPMLIQLPVFIALFTVLRSAVELRFASFLWIADLSQPENLFQDVFGFGINILPIAMAATMALQSYLTPTAGDPAQQKMMMVMMPVMMLVMFYKFPAALGLYWTVSQVFAILALLRTRAKKSKGGSSALTAVTEAPRETRQMRRDRARGI